MKTSIMLKAFINWKHYHAYVKSSNFMDFEFKNKESNKI